MAVVCNLHRYLLAVRYETREGGHVAATMESDELVVNVEHLMAYVDEQRAEGNAAFKAKKHSEALAAWQRALDAIGQAEGKPMRSADVQLILKARSLLHSNRGQALMSMEFWRRAISDLDAALRVDPTNAKALWRRYKSHRELKQWAEAEADLDALLEPAMQEAAGPLLADAGLGAEQLAETRAQLRQKRAEADAAAAASFEDRVEEAAHKGIEELRFKFEEVTKRNGLHGNTELATELGEMLTRPGGVSVSHVANVYQLDDDDAQVMVDWIQAACKMRDELGYQTLGAI